MVREMLEDRMEELLRRMDEMDPTSKEYREMAAVVNAYGSLLNEEGKNDATTMKSITEEGEKKAEIEFEEKKLKTEVSLEREKLEFEKKKLDEETRRSREKNEADLKSRKLEIAGMVVRGAFMIAGAVLNLRGMGWIMQFEKTGAITSKAFQFITKGLQRF